MKTRIWKTVGLDVGDRRSFVYALDAGAELAWKGTVSTTKAGMERHLGGRPRLRVVMEAGTHCHWLSWCLEGLGHEVVVADPRRVRQAVRHERKSDERDARFLAELAASGVAPKLLRPVQPKTAEQVADRALLMARRELVRARAGLIHNLRGLVKAVGHRLPGKSPGSMHKLDLSALPKGIASVVAEVMPVLQRMTEQIRQFDRKMEAIAETRYPETQLFRQVHGVGPITSLAYRLTLGDPKRFPKSREVGAYVGLVPGRHQSGDSDPQLRITKAGNPMLRSLLVQCAHYILGPHGQDSDLRRFGERIIERGGRFPKRRAVVAVARKLAILLHRLWITGEVYDPLRNAQAAAAARS